MPRDTKELQRLFWLFSAIFISGEIPQKPLAVVMAPTRELAIQVHSKIDILKQRSAAQIPLRWKKRQKQTKWRPRKS